MGYLRFLRGSMFALMLASGLAASFPSLAQAPRKSIKVGTFGGPFEQITDAAAQAAKRYGLDVTPVVFQQPVLPNEALVGGEIDANAYQHIVYLNSELRRRGFKIARAADIYTVPLAMYSVKYKRPEDLPPKARIAIPSDEANQGRALLALQDVGLIKLKSGLDLNTYNPALSDIVENPRNLQFVEMSVLLVPKSLPDLDAGLVNANIAFQQAHLTLTDAIAVENKERTKRYTQILVVREADLQQPWVQSLIKAYQSDEVRSLIETQFKNVMTPAF